MEMNEMERVAVAAIFADQEKLGGQTVTVAAPLEEIPVFTREKGLLPLFAEKK